MAGSITSGLKLRSHDGTIAGGALLAAIIPVLIGLGVLSVSATAGPILWTLSPVTLPDGATVSGSFVLDVDTHTASSLALTVGGGTLPAQFDGTYTFKAPNAAFAINAATLLISPQADNTGLPIVDVVYSSTLTDAGGIIPLSNVAVGTCAVSNCTQYSVVQQIVNSGAITASPEPASAATLALGLGAVCWLKFRHRRKNS